MISEVQRIHLYNMAQKMNQVLKIDRNQINAEQIIDISHALDLYELIKIAIINNSKNDAKSIMNAICGLTGAVPISANGNEIIIYRYSARSDIKHIEI